MDKKGALLINLGSPDSPEARDVHRYLAEFLMDPWVIDIPYLWRWLLVHGIVLRTRPANSGALYRKIWTERGSPLRFHLDDLAREVRSRLGAGWVVEGGMRYGNPSLEAALRKLREQGVTEVFAFPMYPQYSESATRSSIEECERLMEKLRAENPEKRLEIKYLPPFFQEPRFVRAFAEIARRDLAGFAHDHVLFSFHGLPERQIRKTDRSAPGSSHCLASGDCCERMGEANRDCYRAQSYATARALASELGLAPGSWSVSFQSRLGRTPWIQPYTDLVLPELLAVGKRKIAVFCPAFVADCLETLEEINLRASEDFRSRGGTELRLVTSLNSTPAWSEAVAGYFREAARELG